MAAIDVAAAGAAMVVVGFYLPPALRAARATELGCCTYEAPAIPR